MRASWNPHHQPLPRFRADGHAGSDWGSGIEKHATLQSGTCRQFHQLGSFRRCGLPGWKVRMDAVGCWGVEEEEGGDFGKGFVDVHHWRGLICASGIWVMNVFTAFHLMWSCPIQQCQWLIKSASWKTSNHSTSGTPRHSLHLGKWDQRNDCSLLLLSIVFLVIRYLPSLTLFAFSTGSYWWWRPLKGHKIPVPVCHSTDYD